MNETIQTILSRRCYRSFKPEQLKQEELDMIMECGLNAPSALNSQGWHFTVIQKQDVIRWMNSEIIKELPQSAKDRMTARNGGNEDFSVFYNAPTVVFVSGVAEDHYSPMNCSFATENMCLAAESLNIGSCIIGLAAFLFSTPKGEEYIKELGIPDGYKPLYAVVFGYKGMEMTKPERASGKVNVIA